MWPLSLLCYWTPSLPHLYLNSSCFFPPLKLSFHKTTSNIRFPNMQIWSCHAPSQASSLAHGWRARTSPAWLTYGHTLPLWWYRLEEPCLPFHWHWLLFVTTLYSSQPWLLFVTTLYSSQPWSSPPRQRAVQVASSRGRSSGLWMLLQKGAPSCLTDTLARTPHVVHRSHGSGQFHTWQKD